MQRSVLGGRLAIMPPRPGDLLDVGIDRLAYGGQGIARIDDFVLFVRGGLPGDRVRVRVTRRKRSFAEARVVELLDPSSLRIRPDCVSADECGGCEWQALNYEAQLGFKQEQVVESLAHIGGLRSDGPDGYVLEPISGMAEPWRYRNKMEYSFAEEEGRLLLGLHKRGSWREVVETDACRLATPQIEAARAAVADACRALALDGVRPRSDATAHAQRSGATRRERAQRTAACCAISSCATESASGDLVAHLFVARHFPEEGRLAELVRAGGSGHELRRDGERDAGRRGRGRAAADALRPALLPRDAGRRPAPRPPHSLPADQLRDVRRALPDRPALCRRPGRPTTSSTSTAASAR